MIILDDVTKIYPHEDKAALDHVSLHIAPKEFVFLVGKSGAGKSTLIRLLTREIKPTSGKIIVGGIDYDVLKRRHIPRLRRRIGVVLAIVYLRQSRNGQRVIDRDVQSDTL